MPMQEISRTPRQICRKDGNSCVLTIGYDWAPDVMEMRTDLMSTPCAYAHGYEGVLPATRARRMCEDTDQRLRGLPHLADHASSCGLRLWQRRGSWRCAGYVMDGSLHLAQGRADPTVAEDEVLTDNLRCVHLPLQRVVAFVCVAHQYQA